jgi:hypothetical protein
MSRVLARFPTVPQRNGTFEPRYNWDQWLDGRVHALALNEYGDAYRFRNAAHRMAKRKGVRIRTAVVDGEMLIQATVAKIGGWHDRTGNKRSRASA